METERIPANRVRTKTDRAVLQQCKVQEGFW